MTPPVNAGPDIIEAAVLNVVTQGEGYPVQLCAPTKHQHRSLLCTSRGKRPLAKDWAALSKSSTMPDLGKWLDGGYNVGIVLDGDLVGLDEDVPGGLEVFFRALGENVPTTLGDIVPLTGKRHLIARLHPDFDPSPLRGTWYSPEGKSLGELIHHRNKQLVSPGCPWSNSDGSLSDWRVWNGVSEFAVLSLAACRALVPPGSPSAQFGFSSVPVPPSRGTGTESSDDWLWDETLGSRHDLLRNHARELRGSTNDEVEITALTWQWGQQHGLTGVHPATQREVTYEEVMDLAFGAVHKFQPDLKLVGLDRIVRTPTGARIETAEVRAINSSGITSIVASQSVEDPLANTYLVTDLIRPKSIGLLVSQTGLGKSLMRSDLAMRLATGTGGLFGAYAIVGKAKVVIYDAENGPDEEHRREDEIMAALGLTRPSLDLLVRAHVDGRNLTSADTQKAFAEHLRYEQPALAVLDTIGSLTFGHEWGEEMFDVMGFLRRMTREIGTAFLLVAHFTKGARDNHGVKVEPDIDDVMGQTARFVDYALLLSPVKDHPERLSFQTKKRIPRSLIHLERNDDGLFMEVPSSVTVAPPTTAKGARQRSVLEAIFNGRLTLDPIIDWLEKSGTRASRATVARDLTDLAALGWTEKDPDHGWHRLTEVGRAVLQPVKLDLT